MAILFLDSSALVKRYVAENGSAWVQTLTDPAAGHRLYVARITGAEMIAAITRRRWQGGTAAADAAAAISAFRADFGVAYYVLDIGPALIARAMDLAENYGLRGYDSVQLAAALELRDQCRAAALPAPPMITADSDLNAAALAESFTVENPNNRP